MKHIFKLIIKTTGEKMKRSNRLIFIVLLSIPALIATSCNGTTGTLPQPSETDTEAVITTAAFRDESTAETPETTSVTEVPVPIDIYACEHEWQYATCFVPRMCRLCYATDGEALGHSPVNYEGYPATCHNDGMTAGQSCDRCAATLVRHERIPATEHTYVTETIAPADGMIGYTRHKCTTCGFSYSDELVSSSYSDGLAYSVNPDGRTCTVTGAGSFTGSSLSVPDVIDGYRVTAIGEHAFAGINHNVTMVIIPEGVKTIEKAHSNMPNAFPPSACPAALKSLVTKPFTGAANSRRSFFLRASKRSVKTCSQCAPLLNRSRSPTA